MLVLFYLYISVFPSHQENVSFSLRRSRDTTSAGHLKLHGDSADFAVRTKAQRPSRFENIEQSSRGSGVLLRRWPVGLYGSDTHSDRQGGRRTRKCGPGEQLQSIEIVKYT